MRLFLIGVKHKNEGELKPFARHSRSCGGLGVAVLGLLPSPHYQKPYLME